MTGRNGLGRSLDGGATWSGLNDTLPNLPVRRLPALPRGAAAHAGGRRTLGVPLRDASPAMFVDRDGAPRVFDADRSGLLDAMATGLGR
ncbi:MAG: hypothetical protein Q8N47_05960, partial [Bryobacterales bacterium]|nr:hypothetical protein [Bryobacterales bacterium]